MPEDPPPLDFDRFVNEFGAGSGAKLIADSADEFSEPLIISEATILACLNDSYALDEIPGDEMSKSQLVDASVLVLVGTDRRLRLNESVRGDLLRRAVSTQPFADILKKTVAADNDLSASSFDPVSVWMRRALQGIPVVLEQVALNDLKALLEALDRLRSAPLPKGAVTVESVTRALQLAELLDPLRSLVGSQGGWEGRPYCDLFAGRAKTLQTLDQFIAETAIDREPALMVIEANGGLGKSALVAKFVLSLSGQNRKARIPFAYFDFDRAALQPREPRHLLAELLRQLALQLEGMAPKFEDLRQGILAEMLGGIHRDGAYFVKCRELLAEAVGGDNVPFLLVLDTLEVAQYDPHAIDGIDRFVSALIGSEFPAISIIAAGRAGLNDMAFYDLLGAPPQRLKLEPLSVDEAREMATNIGRARLGPHWNETWAHAIAATERDPTDRREPLSIRVAVDLLVATSEVDRDRIAAEIALHGEGAHESFVGRLYEQRVLNHVRDKRVRDLIWPGLVVRNVTKEILKDVLAEPCGIELAQLDDVFANLGKELWIVDTWQRADEEVLRHRRELRSRTLPLMRRHDSKLFERINTAAIEYFAARKHEPLGRAEWIYHRLLAGEPVHEIDPEWRDELAPILADAVEDFSSQTKAHLYLLGRTTTAALRPKAVRLLPDWIAFEYITRVASDYGAFDERRLRRDLVTLTSRRKPRTLMSPAAEAAREVLLIKAGNWSEPVLEKPAPSPSWQLQSRFARSFRRARDGRFGDIEVYDLSTLAPDVENYRWLTQELAHAARSKSDQYDLVDQTLAKLLDELLTLPTRSDIASLRTIGVFGRKSCLPAARLWAAAHQQPNPEGELLTLSASEIKMLAGEGGVDALQLASADERAVLVERFAKSVRTPDKPLRFCDQELDRAFRSLLARLSISALPGAHGFITQFFAQRHSDWVIPMAYAAARGLRNISESGAEHVVRHLASYNQEAGTVCPTYLKWRRGERRDPLELLITADEASNLPGMAALLISLMDGDDSKDLAKLVKLQERWVRDIDDVFEESNASLSEVAGAPPPAGPIVHEDDPQKARWGGLSARDGRSLAVQIVGEPTESIFQCDLIIESTDGSTLEGPVIFHLHSTFSRSVIHIRRILDDRKAVLQQVSSYGVFTVGVQCRRRDGKWTSLELDLAQAKSIPYRFLSR